MTWDFLPPTAIESGLKVMIHSLEVRFPYSRLESSAILTRDPSNIFRAMNEELSRFVVLETETFRTTVELFDKLECTEISKLRLSSPTTLSVY